MAPRGSSPRRWRSCLAIVLGGWAVLLVLGEGLARARWTAPWYERLVSEQSRSGSLPYRKNSWQLRDRDYQVPRPPGVRRVLVLGASCVMGSGVPEDQLVFPELLERDLNEMDWPDAPQGVEVLNGGVPASTPRSWRWLWRRIGDDFDPDLLLIVFFLRDGTRTGTGWGFFDVVRDELALRSRDSFLYEHSYLFRQLRDLSDRHVIAERMTRSFHEGYFGNDEQTASWREAREYVRQIVALARERGTRVALAVLPILVELDGRYPFQREVDLFTAFGRELEVPTHDLLPAFRAHSGPELWVSPLDQHPNARAHAVIAASLLPFVAAQLRSAADHHSR